jgi:hypothetical protein
VASGGVTGAQRVPTYRYKIILGGAYMVGKCSFTKKKLI